MRICFLADSNSIHTQKWAEYFASKGNDIYIVSINKTTYKYGNGIKVITLCPSNCRKAGYVFLIPAIRKTVKKIKPDILHSHYASSYGLFGRATGVHPFVISAWGSDIYEFPKNIVTRSLLKFILAGGDRICSTSMAMAQEIKRYYNGRVVLTPFGVDMKRFTCNVPILAHSTITLGTVKALERVYGIDLLLEAFAQLYINRGHDNLRLLIVGDGSEKKYLLERCTKLGISHSVTFTGRVDNNKVPELINSMDIVCLPSRSESFGVSAVEAASCGRPVAASNVGGLTEIVRDGYNGVVFEPENINDMVDKIDKMLEDKERMRQYSLNAIKTVETLYNWENNASIVENIYNELCGKIK